MSGIKFASVLVAGIFTASMLSIAAEAPVKPADLIAPEPKLTNLDCQAILAGLNGLDGHTEITKDGSAVNVTYKFESARLRLIIQQDLAALTTVQQDFTKGMQAVFREIAGDSPLLKEGTSELARYNEQLLKAQQLPCNVKLTRIKAEDLKLDKNEIPGSVLGNLDKILDR